MSQGVRMNLFPLKVVATIVMASLGIMLIRCFAFTDNAAACMRLGVIDAGLWILHFATLAAAIWLGIEAARASKRQWLGWVAGVIVFVLLNVGLSWMGFTLPEHEIDDGSDNSYRR